MRQQANIPRRDRQVNNSRGSRQTNRVTVHVRAKAQKLKHASNHQLRAKPTNA